jgi:hypothetical protein
VLAGRPPFDAATVGEVVTKHATQPAQSLKTFVPDIQPFSAQVIGRMLAKNPAERYQSYDELIHDLTQAQTVLHDAHTKPTIVTQTGERISVASVIATIGALIFCIAVVAFLWINRVKLFGAPAPVPPPVTQTVVTNIIRVTAPPTANPSPVKSEEVDFNEDTPWVKAWTAAASQLAQGHYSEAYLAFDGANNLLRGRRKHRQWVAFFQGVALVAQNRPGESVANFVKSIDALAKPKIPERITPTNFIDVLGQTMLDSIALDELEKAITLMPPWAAGLSQFVIGLKHWEKGNFGPAITAARAYQKMEIDPAQRWAFQFQPLAERLASDSETTLKRLEQIRDLQSKGNSDEALLRIRSFLEKTRHEVLRARLQKIERQIQQEKDEQAKQEAAAKQRAEEERLAREQQEAARAGAELKLVQGSETAVAAFLGSYDFKSVQAKFEMLTAQLQTDAGRQLLDQKLTLAKLLVQFKTQLSADFPRQPYDSSNLQTRNYTRVAGRLARATDTQLIFSTPYGELVSEWRDLAPGTIQQIAMNYAAVFEKLEKPEIQARRYLAMAAFCKQYGLAATDDCIQRAVKFSPELQKTVDRLFPAPPPAPAPAPAPAEKPANE